MRNCTASGLHRFCVGVLRRLGAPPDVAGRTADALVYADLRGVASHGVAQLAAHVERLRRAEMSATATAQLVRDEDTCLVVDGNNGIGQSIATEAMLLAIERASARGVCVCGVRRSNNFGAAGYYARMASDRQMIALVWSNANPSIAPWGGGRAVVGNNPLAIAAPAPDFPVVLDMAHSVATRGAIRLRHALGQPLPDDWAVGENGQAITDPGDALTASLWPVGGYKGFGGAVMAEVLAGVLTGAGIGEEVASVLSLKAQNAGHLFVVFDIARMLPLDHFHRRMRTLVDRVHGAGGPRAALPGERGAATQQRRSAQGVPLDDATWASLERLGRGLHVALEA